MKFNKILAALLAVTVVGANMPAISVNFSKISMTANAAEAESYLEYITLNDGTIEITACDTTITEVEIPSEINGIKVTSIGYFAFLGCSKLTAVTIPDSVTNISNYAFYGCSALKSIVISDSVTSIGAGAFGDCSSLKSITILNPDCEIYDSSSTICNYNGYEYYGVIKGYSGSTAEKYAKEYEREFELFSEASALAMGDVNGDNTVDASDATVVLADYSMTSTGKESSLTDAQKAAADIDKDGKIDASDASLILQFYSYISTGGTETDMSKWINK